MPTSKILQDLESRPTPNSHIRHWATPHMDGWKTIAKALAEEGCYLVAACADDTSDRTGKTDNFEWTHVFGNQNEPRLFAISVPFSGHTYQSARSEWPVLEPYEREAFDMLGIIPEEGLGANETGARLMANFPLGLAPLRRDGRTLDDLREAIHEHQAKGLHHDPIPTLGPALEFPGHLSAREFAQQVGQFPAQASPITVQPEFFRAFLESRPDDMRTRLLSITTGEKLEEGLVRKTVGPVHAGVMPPGLFIFWLLGDVIKHAHIRLGFKHRGIERLFQGYYVSDGWRLAERIAADSGTAHTLAHCQAVEVLLGIENEIPMGAQWLRVLLLELERIAYHIGNTASLAKIGGPRVVSALLAVQRERVLRLNKEYFDTRLLREGLIQPGGVGIALPTAGDLHELASRLGTIVERYLDLCVSLVKPNGPQALRHFIGWPSFYDRACGTGLLSCEDALRLGATGLTAQASGVERDSRILRPQGVYADPDIQASLRDESWLDQFPEVDPEETRAGDIYARFLQRVRSVHQSFEIVKVIAQKWKAEQLETGNPRISPDFAGKTGMVAIGETEGWRGSVTHHIELGANGYFRRVKINDASMNLWPVLEHILLGGVTLDNFPITVNSINPSYAANDG